MSENTHRATGLTLDGDREIPTPSDLVNEGAVTATTERIEHDSSDYCANGTNGWAVTDVVDDEGRHLLLVNDELGIAMLPAEAVESDDWAATARAAPENYTGISAELDSVLAVRTVEHLRPEDDEPHNQTYRLVCRASPTGGEFLECKQTADNGSDGFRAGWFETLPAGISPAPEAGPRNDLELALR